MNEGRSLVLSGRTTVWLALAGLLTYGAVYCKEIADGRTPQYCFLFVIAAFIAAIIGIGRSSVESVRGESGPDSSPYLARILFAALAIHLVVALLIVHYFPGDVIDVFTENEAAAYALLHGIDPYTITQVNIYGPDEVARYYPPGTLVNSRLQFGFVYPPVNLIAVIPGYLLGDVRYSSIAAILLSGLLIARMRMTKLTVAISCILLLNPLTFVLERFNWSEAFVLAFLCATMYAAVKGRWWLPAALGLFICSKQFAIFALPFFILLQQSSWRKWLQLLAQALCVAGVVTVPFALWNFPHFIHDILIFHLKGPFRTDSLSFAVPLGHPIPLSIILGLVIAATAWSLRVTARHPAMFAACYGLVVLTFLSLGRQAFQNYYFLIAQSFWLAAAASVVPMPSAEINGKKATEFDRTA